MKNGILIAVEGIDGAGKTTQVELLGAALQNAGEVVVVSKEPTNGPHGQRIRESAKNGRMSLEEEMETFRLDRLEHVQNLIQPSLDAGKIVILDRYFYSFIAYQGARGASIDELKASSAFAPIPDAVFLLDIDPRISVVRIAIDRGEQPNEFEDAGQLKIVRRIFQDIVGDLPANVGHIINGTRSIQEIQSTIAEVLIDGTLKAKRCAKVYGCDNPTYCVPRLAGQCEWFHLLSIKPTIHPVPALIQRAV